MAKTDTKKTSVIDTGVPFLEVKPEFLIYYFHLLEAISNCNINSEGESDQRVIVAINDAIAGIPIKEEQDRLYKVIDEAWEEIDRENLTEMEKARKFKIRALREGKGGCMIWLDSVFGLHKRNIVGVVSSEIKKLPETELAKFMEGKPDAHNSE